MKNEWLPEYCSIVTTPVAITSLRLSGWRRNVYVTGAIHIKEPQKYIK
jgi:hypothetical protein